MAAVRGRRDRDLEARLRAYFGPDITRAHLKMAEAPMGAISECFVSGTLLELQFLSLCRSKCICMYQPCECAGAIKQLAGGRLPFVCPCCVCRTFM